MKKILALLFCGFFLLGCQNDAKTCQTLVENYCQTMQKGEVQKANTYLKQAQPSNIDQMAKEAGYTGKIKAYFVKYMKHVIGKQWDSYQVSDVSQGKDFYLVTVRAKGISAKAYQESGQDSFTEAFQAKLQANPNNKEKLFKDYYLQLEKEADQLPLVKRQVIFTCRQVKGEWKITSIDLD